MTRVLLGLLLVSVLHASSARAQNLSASAPAPGQSQQVLVCHDKVAALSTQLSPLQKKRVALWTERKTVGTSGGDLARYKLAQLDQEIAQVQKQIDGVNNQIDSENKRCDDMAAAKPAIVHAVTPTPSPTKPAEKPKRNSRRY